MANMSSPETYSNVTQQDRTGRPSTKTVQAPHYWIPQPYFVSVRLSMPRKNHRKGVADSTFASRLILLIVRSVIAGSKIINTKIK